MTDKKRLAEKVKSYEKVLNAIANLEDDKGNDLRAKTVLGDVRLLENVSDEVLELARKIRNEDNLYIWETAIKEAERVLENREKMKAVDSYYSKHY